jgi:F-type H+-transporting ATPase subunit b
MATSAHTEVPAGTKVFPPFQKDTFASQLVWLAICFIALYALMSRVAIPRIGGILESRTRSVSDDLAAAAQLKEQSDAALAAYQKSLADARNRAQQMANETRDKLNAETGQARKGLEAELAARIARAEETIAATRTAAMTNVQGIAVETAAAIVERLIGQAPSPQATQTAVADVLKA